MDDETPLTVELANVSNAWRKTFKSSKKYLRANLHPGNNIRQMNQVVKGCVSSKLSSFVITSSLTSLQSQQKWRVSKVPKLVQVRYFK
jgi:hypothetical protein